MFFNPILKFFNGRAALPPPLALMYSWEPSVTMVKFVLRRVGSLKFSRQCIILMNIWKSFIYSHHLALNFTIHFLGGKADHCVLGNTLGSDGNIEKV